MFNDIGTFRPWMDPNESQLDLSQTLILAASIIAVIMVVLTAVDMNREFLQFSYLHLLLALSNNAWEISY